MKLRGDIGASPLGPRAETQGLDATPSYQVSTLHTDQYLHQSAGMHRTIIEDPHERTSGPSTTHPVGSVPI